MHIITICKIILMIMDGDVPIDLSKLLFRGSGNKILNEITIYFSKVAKFVYY